MRMDTMMLSAWKLMVSTAAIRDKIENKISIGRLRYSMQVPLFQDRRIGTCLTICLSCNLVSSRQTTDAF